VVERREQGATVVFKDVCVTLGKKEILNNVYGMAKVGQMLAIMGPSGMLINIINIHISAIMGHSGMIINIINIHNNDII